MPTKAVGTQAPPVSLKSLDGQIYNLSKTLQSQPVVVLAFYKISCPVCQFAFPFIERLHKSYPEIPIWGVSQDDQADTEAFASEYGVTFPMILDEQLEATVSYGLVSVPSLFVVKADGEIEQTIFGFAKADLEHLNRRLAQAAGVPERPLFTDADDVPTLRPG